MRKACMAGISVLIGISMLAGCGKSLDADTDTVYVQKNGTVLSVDVETLDKDYYDETELKDYVTDAVSTYTGEHGKSAVKLENLSVKDGTATLKMKYKTPEDYTGFCSFSGIFQCAVDGQVQSFGRSPEHSWFGTIYRRGSRPFYQFGYQL